MNKFWNLRCNNVLWPFNSFGQVIFGVNHRNGPIADYSFTTDIEWSQKFINWFVIHRGAGWIFFGVLFLFHECAASIKSFSHVAQFKLMHPTEKLLLTWSIMHKEVYLSQNISRCVYHKCLDWCFPCVVASNSHLTHQYGWHIGVWTQ